MPLRSTIAAGHTYTRVIFVARWPTMGHFRCLKFDILGIAIRLCILAFAVALGFAFKRFQKGRVPSGLAAGGLYSLTCLLAPPKMCD